MRTNRPLKAEPVLTHGGAQGVRITPYKELRRSCLAAMLFEDSFYESGSSNAKRVAELVTQCTFQQVYELAVECRDKMYLRHMPLFLIRELARRPNAGSWVASALEACVQRPDELAEYLAIYWRDKKQPISAGSKRGLARAFRKFDAATLAKYDQDNAVKLRDVLRMVRARPTDREQSETWKHLIARDLPAPDTWEVALSAGGDKKEVFERLLRERKLGGLAFLRNLRNMLGANVDMALIRERFKGGFGKVLPFRFLAAAKYAPMLEPEIEETMLRSIAQLPKLDGKTVLILDVSGSMGGPISGHSELNRLDTAAALAVLAREQSEDVILFCTAGSDFKQIHETALLAPRHGFGLIDQVRRSAHTLGGGGIFLVQCLDHIWNNFPYARDAKRIIVLTDEQDCDHKLKPAQAKAFGQYNYLINVASYKTGIGYDKWVHIDGWSEHVLDFIYEMEQEQQ